MSLGEHRFSLLPFGAGVDERHNAGLQNGGGTDPGSGRVLSLANRFRDAPDSDLHCYDSSMALWTAHGNPTASDPAARRTPRSVEIGRASGHNLEQPIPNLSAAGRKIDGDKANFMALYDRSFVDVALNRRVEQHSNGVERKRVVVSLLRSQISVYLIDVSTSERLIPVTTWR